MPLLLHPTACMANTNGLTPWPRVKRHYYPFFLFAICNACQLTLPMGIVSIANSCCYVFCHYKGQTHAFMFFCHYNGQTLSCCASSTISTVHVVCATQNDHMKKQPRGTWYREKEEDNQRPYPRLPTVTGKRPPPPQLKEYLHTRACARVYLHARAQTSTRPRAHTHLHARLQPHLHLRTAHAHMQMYGSHTFASFTACTYIPVHMHACTRRRARVNALLQGPLPLLLAPDHTSSDLWNPEPWIHTFISWGRRNGA